MLVIFSIAWVGGYLHLVSFLMDCMSLLILIGHGLRAFHTYALGMVYTGNRRVWDSVLGIDSLYLMTYDPSLRSGGNYVGSLLR